MMTRDQHGHHRRRSPESERRRRKERRSSREQVLSHMQHMPEPDRYHANTMRQEPSSHDYYDSQSAAQRSSYYAHPQPPPSQSHYGQSRARSSSSNSSSSSTSSSLLNISRHDRPFGLKTFFTAASERRKRRLRKQRSRRMFRFSNGSSSSDLSDMAYGKGYIDRMRNRDFTPPGPNRRREGSDSGTRPALPKRAQTDEEIIELGRKFAEIARQQNKEDQRRAGRHKPSALLGAAAALSAYKKTSGSGRSDRGLGSSKHSRHDSSDESEWESASEDESSSDDDGLVYGSAVHLPTGGHQPIHISSPPPSSRPGEYEKMLQHKPSIVDPKLFGPVNSLRGHVNTPCGFDKVDRRTVTEGHQRPLPADGSASVSQSETVLFEGRPLQNVYPVPTSDPNVYKTSRGSIVSLERDSRDRPAPVPIQQPQPIVPVSSKVYDTTETDARYSRKSSSSGTALAGAAAAGLAGAAIASVLSDRKDKDDRRDDRDSRRERESEKERDRERDEKRRSKRSDPKYAESIYSESRHGDERDEKRRSKRSGDKYAGSKYTDSQIGDDRDEKRRSRRSDDKSTNERDEKRKSRDDDRDLERAERRREKERLKELERGALKQTADVAPEPPRDFSNPIVDRDYGILYGREYRGLDRREDRKREQERREEKQRLEEMERQEELERRKEKSLASRSSDADTYRRIEDLNDPSARGPIDPFQFQVANDAFATPQRPLTPNVFTVSREPNFSGLGDDYDRPMERLSRKDSYERELRDAEAIYDSTRTATAPIAAGAIAAATAAIGMEHRRGRSTSRGGDESSRVREDHKDVVQDVANILYRRDMLARQAAEDRSRSASPDQSIVDKWASESGSTKPEITTPPAKDVPKPRSPYDGPDADVRIDRILSPEDLPLRHSGRPFKSRDPSAERDRPMLNIVRPTPVPTPQPEQQQTREELREEASEERESKRESKKKKKKNPPLVEQYRSTDDVVYNTRSEVSSTPSTPTSKGVTWGENETRRYVVESPERGNDEYSGARVVVPAEKPKSKSGKKSGWGILASAIAGTGAAAAASALSDSGKDKDADETSSHISTSSKRSRDRDSPREEDIDRFETSSNISSSSRKSKDRDSPKGRDRDEISSSMSSDSKKPRDRDSADLNDKIRDDIASNLSSSSRRSRDRDAVDKDGVASIVSSSSRKSRGSPPKEQRSSFIPWDEAEDPPVPGPKPSGLRGSPMPGSFAEDLAFTATIAAGLQDSGFDPNLVIDDAKYHRRDSPPNTTDKPAFYQSPFSESVSDVNKFHVAPTGSTVGSEPGFILGEIPETPQDERDLPLDSVDLSKLSKKERKKLEKAAKRASVDNYDLKSQIVVEEEPETFQAASEPIVKDEDDWASITKLSKKDQKKRDKAARAKVLQEEDSALSTPRDSEPETPQQPQDGDEWASSSKLSKKEKKKLEKAAKAKSLQEDEVIEVSTPQEPESQAIEPVFDEWEDTYSSKKSKKDKKKDKLVFADEDTRGFNDSTDSKVSVPVDSFRDLQEEAQLAQPAQPEDDWSAPSKKSKKKSKRDSVAFDWTTEPALPTGEASQGDGQKEASISQPEDAWSTSSKKSKKKSKRESEIFDTALHTPLPAEEAPREIVEESTYAQPEDDWATPTSKKSKKKSKRNSEIYESPSQSIILPEVENLRDTQENSSAQPGDDWSISSKKSKKKSKRDSEIYDSPSRSAAQSEVGETSYKPGDPENTAFLDDEWDTPKKSKKHTKQDSFATDNTDWTNVPSIVSESMIKSQSTDDFSVAEAAGGDDWEVPVKKSKKKSKRDSTNYDSPSQTPIEQNDVVESPKALTDSFADLRSDRSRDPVDEEWNESKKSKKSKRHSYHESLPETDNGSESSEKRSKKEKRRSLPGGFPDDFDVPDQGDPPDRGRGDYPFVDNDVSSVVSVPLRDRSERRKSRSRFDDLDDDAKSIASAPGGSRKRDSKSEKDKEKRNSTGSGFFDRFKSSIGIVDDKDKSSRDDEKKSLKDNADTLGASVGLLGAAAALIKSQMSPTNATDVPSEEKEALSDPITPSRQRSPSPSQRRLSDSIDPEIVEREIRPAIDPQYGDLLPLPPSPPPGSPKTHETDELPALPDSRPETPEHERQLRREMLNKPSHVRRKSANETPTKLKSPSQSAIPLRFGMKGKRPSEPSSPVTRRLTPTSSPIATPVESLSAGKGRPTRPTSWDSSREFKPLYLVERTSRDSVIPLVQHAEDLPQIPESGSSSHASLDPQPEGHEADFPFEYAQTLPRDLPLGLDIPAALAENDDTTHLGSQETTPKARDLPDALVTSPQAEQKLEDSTLPSPTENRSQGTPKLESIAPMSTDLKNEIPIEENVGLGLMNDVPAGIDAAVALLDDNNLPVDDAKMEAGASDLSPMVSKKSKKGKKGKKNKKALDWEPEPDSTTIATEDVTSSSAPQVDLLAEKLQGNDQQEEIKPYIPTPMLEPSTRPPEESSGPALEPESVYATPMDFGVAPADGFAFPEETTKEPEMLSHAQESTDTFSPPVNSEDMQASMADEFTLPAKKSKKKKGKKSQQLEPEPVSQLESDPPLLDDPKSSTAEPATSDDVNTIVGEPTPSNDKPTSHPVIEPQELQEQPVAHLSEDAALSRALEPQPSGQAHAIPLGDQLTTGTSELETANVEIESSDRPAAPINEDTQVESHATEISNPKSVEGELPEDVVVAESMQPDSATPAGLDLGGPPQDPLPTNDPDKIAIVNSAQPPSPWAVEAKQDLEVVPDVVPSVADENTFEPMTELQQEVSGKKKKKNNKKDKKRQSTSWETEPEVPAEVPLPHDPGVIEAPSEPLSASNETQPSIQPEMETAPDDIWSAPIKSGKKGKKGKKNRQSVVLDDSNPLPLSETPADSPVIHEDSKELPTESHAEHEALSTSWADEVEENLPAAPEPEPEIVQQSASSQPKETDPEAEFAVSKKKSKKDKKKNRSSVPLDDTPGEVPAEQSHIETASEEPVHEAPIHSTSDPVSSFNETRDIPEAEPEKDVTDDLWPTSSKKSKKKKKKDQLVQWEETPSASEVPQTLQESNAPNLELPASTSEEQVRDSLATQEPGDTHDKPHPTADEIPDSNVDFSQEQAPREVANEPDAIAAVASLDDSQALSESNVPANVTEDFAPADHTVGQVDETVSTILQDEAPVSQAQVEAQNVPETGLLQPSVDDETAPGETVSASVGQEPLIVNETTGGDEHIKIDDVPTVIAEEEFPLTKKSKKDKKKKKRQTKIDDLLDSGASTPKEETSLDTAETETLPQNTTQDEAQSRELSIDDQPLDKNESAEPGDQQQDDEWANFSSKKSKKDKKKKKKGSQNIEPDPEAEQPVLEDAPVEQPSSAITTPAADAVIREPSDPLVESVPSTLEEPRNEPFEHAAPAADLTEAATQPEQETFQDAREIPVNAPRSTSHDIDQPAGVYHGAHAELAEHSGSPREPADASHDPFEEVLPEVQLKADNGISPPEDLVVAEDDAFTAATSKKSKKKKKRQSLAQESEATGTSSFDTVTPDEPQASPAPGELPSTSVEQSTDAQMYEPGEISSQNPPDKIELQESHEPTERSLINPDEAFAAQPTSPFTDNHVGEMEPSVQQDQPIPESQQQEAPSALPDQLLSLEPSGQQISNPELIEDIKHITHPAEDETGLPSVIQVGETLPESTPGILVKDATDEQAAHDEPSSTHSAQDAQEPGMPVPEPQPTTEAAPAEEDQGDFFVAPKSKKDKKKKKRAGQNFQEDPVTTPAEDSPTTASQSQDPEPDSKQDLTEDPSQQSKELQVEDAVVSTPVLEDDSLLAVEPEFSTAKKSKKDKKKKKQAVSSWTDDLPQDQTEVSQAEGAADIEASAEQLSSDLPLLVEEPGNETPLETETLKDDDFTEFTSSKKSKKDKKKKKQLTSPWEEEVQQEQTPTSDEPSHANTNPPLEEAFGAEAPMPTASAPIEDILEFIPAKKSKKDKKKKNNSSWEPEGPQGTEALPEESRETGPLDAGPSKDFGAAFVDSPNIPDVTANDDDFSGFTSAKKSKKDKKKKRASAWEPEPEPDAESEGLTTISREDPVEPANEAPLALASHAAEPVLDDLLTQASQEHGDVQLEHPSITQDTDTSQDLHSRIPEDLQPQREENEGNEVADEPSHILKDLEKAPPSILIDAPHDTELAPEQKEATGEQQIETNADDQLLTEPSTVFATPLGELTPQEDPRDLPEAAETSSSAQEVPEPENELFVTKKSKKDKKKKKQASQIEDLERESSVPPTTESPLEDQSVQVETQPIDDNALLDTQEAKPEDAFPEFISTKKSKKDKKKKKAGQAQDWEAETEPEPESAFMTPLEEPDKQMERQLPAVSTGLSPVDEFPVDAESSPTAQPDPAVVDAMTAETVPESSTAQSEDIFSEIPSGKKSKKDKKKKRASQLQDWEADSSPTTPAHEEPVAAPAADVNTDDVEQIPDQGASDPKEPEASELIVPGFTTGKKSKKDKKKAKAALTPDVQEPDSFYTPMEETQQALEIAEDVTMPEPAIEPTADDLSTSKDVEPEDEFPEFTSSKKSKKDKKKKKDLQFDWEEPTQAVAESDETQPTQNISPADPLVDTPGETKDVAFENPDMSTETQAEEEFPEFVSTKKSKKDKKKAKMAAALAAIADAEPESRALDSPSAEANSSLPAEPEPVITSEAPISSPILESTAYHGVEVAEARAEPIDDLKVPDPTPASSLEPPAEAEAAATSDLKGLESIPTDESTAIVPDDTDEAVRDRSAPEDEHITHVPTMTSAGALIDQTQDQATEFPEFSVKKSKKDKKKAKKAKAAEPLPWEDDALATGAQSPLGDEVPSQPDTQDLLLPAPETEVGLAEMPQEPPTLEPKPEEVPANVTDSQLPVDIAPEAPSEHDPPASKDIEVDEFPITRKKSKKDKKKAKAAALLVSEPTSGTETPMAQDEQAINLSAPESLAAVEPQESTTHEVAEDVPTPEPLQLNIGGKLVSEEPESSQQATDDWPEFSSKKTKKDKKKKSKSTADFETERTPEVLDPSLEEPELRRDLDVAIPETQANDSSITEQPIVEEPQEVMPADDEWPQYSTKKSKKDKKKRKTTGILESEPASGTQTPLAQEAPMEESFSPAIPSAEPTVEEDITSSAPIDVQVSSAPVEDDDWSNFTAKKSKKDKKGKKKGKSSGSATPAEASVPLVEASRAALSEEPATIESSKAKDVWDDDSFFKPRESSSPSYRDEGFGPSGIVEEAAPATPVRSMDPFTSAISPAVDVDLSPAQLTSHVDHDKPFDQTTQPGKKVRTNTFLGDTEIPEPISAIEPEPASHGSDILVSQDSSDAKVENTDVHAVPETTIEDPASQPDQAPSPAPTAREFAADYLDPEHSKHSHRQNDKAAVDWTSDYSSPLPQATSERDIAVSYLESHSRNIGDLSFETELLKSDPLVVPPSEVKAAYNHENQAVTGDNDHRGVVVAEYPPKIDQPSPKMSGFAAQDSFYSVSGDFAEPQSAKSQEFGKSPMSKDEIEKEDNANDADALAAAAALTGGVAMLASKFGGAKKVKVKKGKKSKYVDKRQPKEDDIFDDPMLWESSERKIMTGNDGGRLDMDTGDFWDVQDETEETPEVQPEKLASKETELGGAGTEGGQVRGITHGIIANSSELPESPIVGHNERNTGPTQPEMPLRVSAEHLKTPGMDSASELIKDIDELDTTEPIPSRGTDASPVHDIRTQMISPNRDFTDWARSSIMSARSLPPVEEEPNEEFEDLPKPQSDDLLRTPEINRDSGFVAESPLPVRQSLFDDESGNRDSGVHMKDWHEETGAQASREVTEAQPDTPRDVQTPKTEEKRGKKSHLSEETPRLGTPSRSLGDTSPDPEKRSRSHAAGPKTPRSAKYESLNTGASPALTPHAFGQQKSFSDKMVNREGSKEENAGTTATTTTTTTTTTPRSVRSTSNTSVTRLRTPEPLNLRPDSPGSIRSSGTSTPPLRRVDKRMSGDLRSLSQHNNNGSVTSLHSHHSPHSRLASPVPYPGARPASALSSSTPAPAPSASPSPSALATAKAKGGSDKDVLAALQVERRRQTATATSTSSTPVANEGRVRAKDMTDVYDGVGEGRIGSPRSPTRPHSMRRRQSMQVLELESKVEQLIAENRALTEARLQADVNVNQRAAVTITERDTLIEQLRSSLEEYKREVQRLKEVNEGLQSANSQLAAQHSERYSHLEHQHASASSTLQDKDAEIQQLRDELEATKQQVREMQQQILATKPADADFLRLRDEDYFDNRCQQLCAHVQQWVLRFSKFSDMRASRLTSEINDVKIVDRLDNTVLDGSDVDDYLSDRVKRRDVFMSMTMHMVWEYVFTRYLFGMDREQRQKLKALEKLLSDVGPPHAVRQWRAVTLTLLSRRPAFGDQRNDDTEAVVQAILETLSKILPPPSNMENQIQSQLRRVLREAVDLSIEMRTQRAEYMMLPPLQPEYDGNGDLAETVAFNAALMNERSGGSTSNEDLEANGAVVRMVLFPLVIKKGDDNGLGDDEIVVCPAQVLVQRSSHRSIRMVTPSSEFGGGAPLSRGATPSAGFKSAVSLPMSPAPEGADSHMEGAF